MAIETACALGQLLADAGIATAEREQPNGQSSGDSSIAPGADDAKQAAAKREMLQTHLMDFSTRRWVTWIIE